MPETGMIYKKLIDVMRDIGAVGKDSRNAAQGFMYRGIDAVMNAIAPAFQKHGVFAVPDVLDIKRETHVTEKQRTLNYSILTIRYTFYAEDGSSVSAVVIGEAQDSADKATNKAMAVGFKYALFQVLCIPTEEMQDPDAEYVESAPAGHSTKQSAKSGGTKAGAAAAKDVKGVDVPDTDPTQKIGEAHVNVIRQQMERTGIQEKQLLDVYHIKTLQDMTVVDWNDCMRRFKATKDKEGK